MSNRKQKDWWCGYVDTHPDLEKKLPTAYANEKERRPKVMCKAYKISRIIDEQQADRESQRQGLQNDVRTQEQIIGYCKFFDISLVNSSSASGNLHKANQEV
ncbi:hypothetical protein K503DRAFT_460884 [Rhizopogon vinicolor AM-OR11-026]|uniref:Uncharacterized protein n=1 Tax=Rhizopogon vinicolor AM-OR11-026 TaxID=1314800 RepID=A0A1B7MNV1_9AGAM|nr:hypothetical protein K503DRAFT_460884 [Rhizopogon vinicolor AM-OR11-026]